MEKITLGIDARLFGAGDRGLGRYTQSIVQAIHSSSSVNLVLFVRPNSAGKQWADENNVSSVEVDARPYSWQEQVYFLRSLLATKCDLVHFPHFNVPVLYRKPYVVTVHDLILHHFPNRSASRLPAPLFWLKYILYRIVLTNTIHSARSIIAVSDYTREDILDHYYVSGSKVQVVREMVELFTQKNYDDSAKKWYNKFGQYALVVGAAYPHKNLSALVKAWVRIGTYTKIQLVLVVPNDAFGDKIRKLVEALGLDHRQFGVIILGPQSDDELKQLYIDSNFVILPTLYEGVGLTGLEAMQNGAQVLSSAESVLPEVYGDSVTYINVRSVMGIEKGVIRALSIKPQDHSPSYPIQSSSDLAVSLKQIYEQAIKFS